MADVTISQLTPGTPAGNNILPYSTGTDTLGAPVSAIFQNAGYIGIGSNSPQCKLHVYNASDSSIALGRAGYPQALAKWEYNSGICYFGTRDSDNLELITNNVPRLSINTAGNVGIGTSSPQAKLDVNGTIKATGLNVPGTIIQTVYGQDGTTYDFPNPGTSAAPLNLTSTLIVNLKSVTSRVIIDVTAYGYGYRNSTVPGWGLYLLYNGESMLPAGKTPYIHLVSSSVDFITGSLNIKAQHTPGILNPTYRLAIQKPSFAGTGKVVQESSYWTITEIAQ